MLVCDQTLAGRMLLKMASGGSYWAYAACEGSCHKNVHGRGYRTLAPLPQPGAKLPDALLSHIKNPSGSVIDSQGSDQK